VFALVNPVVGDRITPSRRRAGAILRVDGGEPAPASMELEGLVGKGVQSACGSVNSAGWAPSPDDLRSGLDQRPEPGFAPAKRRLALPDAAVVGRQPAEVAVRETPRQGDAEDEEGRHHERGRRGRGRKQTSGLGPDFGPALFLILGVALAGSPRADRHLRRWRPTTAASGKRGGASPERKPVRSLVEATAQIIWARSPAGEFTEPQADWDRLYRPASSSSRLGLVAPSTRGSRPHGVGWRDAVANTGFTRRNTDCCGKDGE